MKKTIKHLLLLTGVLLSTGCTSVVLDVVDAFDPNQLEDDWANKGSLRELMNNQNRILLTKKEKQKVAKFICLQASKKDKIFTSLAERGGGKEFCNLENEDKIYFFKEFKSSTGLILTEYLLVIKNEPYDIVEIKRKYSKELGRTIPIVERLH